MKKQRKFDRAQSGRATERYHKHYNNELYREAIEGKTVTYANWLIDEALAICGHPREKLSYRNWSPAALAFLEKFS